THAFTLTHTHTNTHTHSHSLTQTITHTHTHTRKHRCVPRSVPLVGCLGLGRRSVLCSPVWLSMASLRGVFHSEGITCPSHSQSSFLFFSFLFYSFHYF